MAAGGLWKLDWLFVLGAACLALLSYMGLVEMSGAGVIMDSDLQTYAQGMAAGAQPELFAGDPAVGRTSPGNSIPNLERMLAALLAPGDNWGVGLLRAGSVAIFTFFTAWYFLGRWLYGSPALAALLAVCCGVTVWVGWGTFWGILHSDPIPRVFFGALLPILLWLAIGGMTNACLRPLALLLAGLMIYAHGVSALNAGAMIFCAFALRPAPGQTSMGHLGTLFLGLVLFFVPTLCFLWPSLFQGRQFTAEELTMFRQLMDLRWHDDYADFGSRMLKFFSPFNVVFPILAGGMAGWMVALWSGNAREKALCRMIPGAIIGLALVALFCWAESRFAPSLGRLPMGHELVRGMKFLVPLGWLAIVAGIGCLTGPWLRRLLLVGAMGAFLFLSQDRQLVAAEYAFTRLTGVRLPLSHAGELARAKAANFREVMQEVKEKVPQGEALYSPEDIMPVRFVARRPLAHSFKDGYLHFYNKDAESSRRWLRLEELGSRGPAGWMQAWRESGAPWLLISAPRYGELPKDSGLEVILDKNGYILARRN